MTGIRRRAVQRSDIAQFLSISISAPASDPKFSPEFMPNFKEFWLPTTTSASVNLNPSSVCLVSVIFLIFLFSASLCPNRKSETLLSLPIPVLELCSGIERKLSHPRRQCGFSPLLSSSSFFLHLIRTQRFGRSVYKTLPPLHSQRL